MEIVFDVPSGKAVDRTIDPNRDEFELSLNGELIPVLPAVSLKEDSASLDAEVEVAGIEGNTLKAFGFEIPLDRIVNIKVTQPVTYTLQAQVVDATDDGKLVCLPLNFDPKAGARLVTAKSVSDITLNLEAEPLNSLPVKVSSRSGTVFPNGQPGTIQVRSNTFDMLDMEVPTDREITVHLRNGEELSGRAVYFTRNNSLVIRTGEDFLEGPAQLVPRESIRGIRFSVGELEQREAWKPREFSTDPDSSNSYGSERDFSGTYHLHAATPYQEMYDRYRYPIASGQPVEGIENNHIKAFDRYIPLDRPVRIHFKTEAYQRDCIAQILDVTEDGNVLYFPMPEQAMTEAMFWKSKSDGAISKPAELIKAVSFLPDAELAAGPGETVLFPSWREEMQVISEKERVDFAGISLPLDRELRIKLVSGEEIKAKAIWSTYTGELILRDEAAGLKGGARTVRRGSVQSISYDD